MQIFFLGIFVLNWIEFLLVIKYKPALVGDWGGHVQLRKMKGGSEQDATQTMKTIDRYSMRGSWSILLKIYDDIGLGQQPRRVIRAH